MKKILSAAFAFLFAVLIVSGTTASVHAQSTGLGIAPRNDLTVAPGNSIDDKLFISNLDSDQALVLNLQIVDFGAKDETGTPSLQLDEDAEQTSWSLKPFITAPKALTLKPGESRYVDYKVNIPKDQGAGSYYSAIQYVAQSENGGNVNITASGATLVFVTVPGITKESLTLQKFGAYVPGKNNADGDYKSLFVKGAPEKLAFTLKNQGNVAEQPTGSILIKNMFGKQVKVIKNLNPKNSLALIEQTRRFEVCITDKQQKENDKERNDGQQDCEKTSLMPGRYSAELAGFYGINGNTTQDISATASFWYLPVWFLVILFIVILAIAGGIFFIYRKATGRGSFKTKR